MERYADIVLPLAQPAYTYAVADGLDVEEGQAVAVQFGARRIYTGIVWRIHGRRPDFPRIKTVSRVLYDRPLLDARQRALWEWMADYYLCTLGEVMRFALPQTIKPSGNSEQEFADREYRPRTELYAALDASLHDEERFHDLMERLSRRAPRQYAALLAIASAEGGDRISTGEVPRRLLEADAATLAALQKKGLVTLTRRERSVERGCVRFQLPTLTPAQQSCLDTIRGHFDAGRRTVLLHGITGSGKTELYIHLIAEALARGGDVLLLVPEIAITAQLIARLERIFGSRVTAYHSKLTLARRTESYLRLTRSDGGELVVGARSALFLPLRHLQLIVVDEEHDTGYKQTDAQPRYNARDVAVVMARLREARTVLGSATPSLESYANALSGKYGLATLAERYGDARPPLVLVSDTLRAVKRNERKTHFNRLLLDKLADVLARGEQAMLFQNRRGFAPYVECRACGWTARCPRCNVTLTYHKRDDRLQCHYCGHVETVPVRCPACRAGEVTPAGFGTEKVEEELARLFPAARIERLDRDTATSERAYRAIIDRFESGQSDLLVGTQMITKGFDFARVSLVGILNADNLLFAPDFRAAELPADDASGRTRRTARRGGRSGDPDHGARTPRHPAGRRGRLRSDGAHAAGRTPRLRLSALRTADPPDAPPARPRPALPGFGGARRGAARPFRQTGHGAGRSARRPHPRGVHHRIPAQNRERRLGLPCPGSAARGAPADARCERVPNRNAQLRCRSSVIRCAASDGCSFPCGVRSAAARCRPAAAWSAPAAAMPCHSRASAMRPTIPCGSGSRRWFPSNRPRPSSTSSPAAGGAN